MHTTIFWWQRWRLFHEIVPPSPIKVARVSVCQWIQYSDGLGLPSPSHWWKQVLMRRKPGLNLLPDWCRFSDLALLSEQVFNWILIWGPYRNLGRTLWKKSSKRNYLNCGWVLYNFPPTVSFLDNNQELEWTCRRLRRVMAGGGNNGDLLHTVRQCIVYPQLLAKAGH